MQVLCGIFLFYLYICYAVESCTLHMQVFFEDRSAMELHKCEVRFLGVDDRLLKFGMLNLRTVAKATFPQNY